MLVAGASIIGLAPILVRVAHAGPAAVGFWRLLLSLPILAVMTRRSGGGIGRPTGLALLAGLAFALDLGFWHYGIVNTSVGKATVLTNLTPVVVIHETDPRNAMQSEGSCALPCFGKKRVILGRQGGATQALQSPQFTGQASHDGHETQGPDRTQT